VNSRAFRSKSMLLPALVVALCAIWAWVGGIRFGRGPDTNVPYLLTTGWAAFAIYLFLFAYMVRKNAHRYGFSPEFRRELPLARLEEVERELSVLRGKALSGVITGRERLEAEARRILTAAGCDDVLRAEVSLGADPRQRLELRAVPKDALRPLHAWFRGHLCWGLAAVFLVCFHGGKSISSPMAGALNVGSWIVLGSGLVGVLLFTIGPYWLTRRERDLSLEKALALCDHFGRKLEEMRRPAPAPRGSPPWDLGDGRRPAALAAAGVPVAVAEASAPPAATPATTDELRAIDAALADPTRLRELLASDAGGRRRDYAILASQQRAVEREWRALSRIRGWMHGWRVLHVPAAIVLLAVVLVHVVSVIWY